MLKPSVQPKSTEMAFNQAKRINPFEGLMLKFMDVLLILPSVDGNKYNRVD